MRHAIASIVVCASATIATIGCTAEVHEPVAEVGVGAEVDVGEPVIDVGAVQLDVEPAPDQRVYVYDPGFPPGVYLYDNYYYYGGYRYSHDEFVNRYVQENIRRNRYTNVEENRQKGRQIEQQHRTEFARTGGHRTPARRAPANQNGAKPAEHPSNRPQPEQLNRTTGREDHPAARTPDRTPAEPAIRHDEHRTVTPDEPREKRPTGEPPRNSEKPAPRPNTPSEKPAHDEQH